MSHWLIQRNQSQVRPTKAPPTSPLSAASYWTPPLTRSHCDVSSQSNQTLLALALPDPWSAPSFLHLTANPNHPSPAPWPPPHAAPPLPPPPSIALLLFTRCKLFPTAGVQPLSRWAAGQTTGSPPPPPPLGAVCRLISESMRLGGGGGAGGVGCSRVNDGVRPAGALHMRAIWGVTARSSHATWLIIKQTGPVSTITRVSRWAGPAPPTAGSPPSSRPPFVSLTQRHCHVFFKAIKHLKGESTVFKSFQPPECFINTFCSPV